jgi:hypothetical protein
MKKMSFNKRNLKYGGFSIALTAFIVAAIIIVNVAVTSLSSTFSWYTDLTGTSIYSVSEAFHNIIKGEEIKDTNGKGTGEYDGIMGVNFDNDDKNDLYINIVLLMEEDSFKDYSAYTYYVYHTLKQIVRDNDHINLKCINSLQYPEYVQERYMKSSSDAPVMSDVIFEIADEYGNPIDDTSFKKYTINSFYLADSESGAIVGYNAETKILSAIAQLAGKVGADTIPVAYFLQGHSEPGISEATDWVELFQDAGYAVKEINLVTENFPETITKGSLVFINQPQTDLSVNTTSGKSELQKLRSFAATSYGNVIAALDSTVPFLPNLDALMSEWGVALGGSVTDDAHSVSASKGNKIFADYSLTTGAVAKSVLAKATGTSENRAYTLFENPRAFYVYDAKKIDYLYHGAAVVNVDVLLAPYDTAKINGEIPSGAAPALASITRIIHNVNYEAETTHYILCLGSSDFIDSSLDKTNYNKTLMYQALNLMWSGALTFDEISYKKFDNKALSVTTEQTNAWTIACVAVIPALFLVAGTIVWVRRRHS